MNLRFRIHQARIAGVPVTLRKTVRKFANPIAHARERRRAYKQSSYEVFDVQRHGKIRSLLHLPPVELLSSHKQSLIESAAQYCQHCFFLPGVGWQQWQHGAAVQGNEGFRYSQEAFPYNIDDDGTWVTYLVNQANATESQRIWQLIFSDDRKSSDSSFSDTASASNETEKRLNYSAIDWQRDMRSGYSWTEGQWWRDLRVEHAQGVDPKVPWDVGRMHHLVHLTLAHYISRDESQRSAFVTQFRSQLLDFLALNPPGFGVQWKSPMDVAIRLANILVAWDLLKQQGWLADAEFENVVTRSTYEHARFVVNNLEWSDGMRANHYLSNLAGLSVYAAYVPDSGISARIRELVHRSLPEETLYQFHEDGSHFEASLSYHFFSAEMLCWAWAFNTVSSTTVDRGRIENAIERRLRAILDFSQNSLYSSGSCPQIGDNDGGHFLQFFAPSRNSSSELGTQDRHPIVALNAALLEAPNPCGGAELHYRLLHSLRTSMNQEAQSASIAQQTPGTSNVTKPNFGISRFQAPQYVCFLRAGSVGQLGKGGHAHNDQLSLTLEVDDKEVFCDPGTYVYTSLPEKRNLFRSTVMHNTLCIDGLEQNDLGSGGGEALFWMQSDRADAQILVQDNNTWSAQHDGFGVRHQRSVTFNDNELLIIDRCEDARMKTVRFHLHPLCKLTQLSPHLVRVSRASSVIELQCIEHEIRLNSTLYSPEYGACMPSQCLSVSTTSARIETCVTIVTS